MTDQAPDNPNVVIFPPILLLATIITGIVLDWLVPIGRDSRVTGNNFVA